MLDGERERKKGEKERERGSGREREQLYEYCNTNKKTKHRSLPYPFTFNVAQFKSIKEWGEKSVFLQLEKRQNISTVRLSFDADAIKGQLIQVTVVATVCDTPQLHGRQNPPSHTLKKGWPLIVHDV